ncbi:MAG: dihydrofolate reductase [Bacteroidota bacterium]|nr:dihydrofolate reductase [Candidatus Kapabacteria bacterium]MCS7302737.1 dihydrofolate reductase [Candidatus Kapabacteria bacterium]MCX7937246.1 dihydrofolate reductase [Chlorobiota bacterium]MDW8075741.1 dihydrofolate reductase [Bacteroidota bacterium]MDW8272487.1 dihydrofolate reductase [Bacteroidota bacterium]
MIVSIIVAYDSNRGIGRSGRLPWHIPADLRLFKALTWGHHIVMGRRTFESIGRVLPGRTTIVVTSSAAELPPDCLRASSLRSALDLAQQRGETECFIVGGAVVYAEAIQLADRLYVSEIEGKFDCDVFFPAIDASQWKEQLCRFVASADTSVPSFRFRVLERHGRVLSPVTLPIEVGDQC